MFARRALDWTDGLGRPPAERPRSVDIVIPVYGAAAELRACLASVVAHTDLAVHRVILVADGPQEDAVDAVIAEHPDMLVLRNPHRLGFVASVNRGMSESETDVVLLNSDTVVTPRWIDKLIDAACSSGDVGTVTPLSNHATLCSVPRPFVENLLPNGWSADSFARLVEDVSRRQYPRIPTGVGVCLYIRRALLAEIGLFDADRFGLGYGEENDFCVRALKQKWLHVVDDATFIEHAGHASFGHSSATLQRRVEAVLRRLHPRYMATIAAFMALDPLASVRARITDALGVRNGKSQRRVVHLVHGWPPFQQAGTELYAAWLVRQQSRAHHVAVYTRSADPARIDGDVLEWLDEGVRVRFVTNNFTARDPMRRNAIADRSLERDFARFLQEERPELVHIHHLAGHAFSLVKVARRLGIPIVLQIQDWWFLCARVNLFDRDGNRCSGPELSKCMRCATLTKVAPSSVTNRALHVLRRRAARSAIAECDAYVAGSNAIRGDYVRAGIVPLAKPFHVIPYGVDVEQTSRSVRHSRPIRFGYVGSILPHKGLHTAVEAMRGIGSHEASLHLWGDPSSSREYVEELKCKAGDASVVFAGAFREAEKPRVFASIDVLLVPSIGLESFGLAAREAMASGVPVIATEGAALSEMFEAGTCGELFPAGDVAALHLILRRIVEEPEIVDRWSAKLPKPKRTDAHAAEIAAVYDAVLAARES